MRLTSFAVIAFAFLLSLMPLEEARGETLMQCMEQCIQYEGGNSATNKETCKNRCGAKLLNQQKQQQSGKRDCMGEFKNCNKGCGKEKIGKPSPCHKQCKARLRTCT